MTPATEPTLTAPTNPATPEAWPTPAPLPPMSPKPPALPPALIPEPIRERVIDVADRTGVPKEAVLAPMLAGLGSLIGNTQRVYPKARDEEWYEEPIFWSMLIAGPSTKKTATITNALRPLRTLETEIAQEYRAEEHTRAASLRSVEAQISAKEKKIHADASGASTSSSLPTLEAELAELLKKKAELERNAPRLVVNDATVEKLGKLLSDNPKGLVLVRDELTGLFAQMNSVGRENDRPFFLEAYNPDAKYTFDRIGRGTVQIDNPTVSIVGGIQLELLRPHVETAVRTAGGDGFLTRFQLPVLYDLFDVEEDEDRPVNKRAEQRSDAIHRKLQQTAQAHASSPASPPPTGYHFAPDAQGHIDAWRKSIDERSRSRELQHVPAFQAHLGKSGAAGIRLALLLHAIDAADGNPSPQITLQQAQNATQLLDYYLIHAAAMYEAAVDPAVKDAHALLSRFENGDFPAHVNTREIQQKTGIKREPLRRALATLERHGWLRVETVSKPGARASTYVNLNPAILQEPSEPEAPRKMPS